MESQQHYVAFLLLLLTNIGCICKPVESQENVTVSSLDHGKHLVEYLNSKYGSKTIRPAGNLSESVEVSFRNLVVQVIDFDEISQQITLNGWMKAAWKDSLLQWNPDDFGGISLITIDPTLIWTPDITLYENVSPGFITQSSDDCLLTSDGTVTWFTNVITTSSCPVQVRYFPFDVQVCTLTYSSWIYTKDALDLIYPNDSDSEQDVYFQNGVWSCEVDVENKDVTYTCCPQPYSLVIYTLRLQRLYQHYLVNMVAPGILLSFLNIAVFLIPPESGEKISFAVANLLSAILFQQLISEYMPPLGSQIPLLGIYFMFTVIASCFSLTASMAVLRVFYISPTRPMSPLCSFLCGFKRPKLTTGYTFTDSPVLVTTVETPTYRLRKESSSNGNANGTGNDTGPSAARARASGMDNDWKRLARRLDIMLCVFVCIVSLAVITYIVVIYASRPQM